LDVIKTVSDQATREYSVKQALDNLEQEAKEIEFDFIDGPDQGYNTS
jgi:hypothetical protein